MNDAKELQCQSNFNVVQANDLLRSKQDCLSIAEARIIRLAIAQTLQEDTELKEYTCSIPKLARYIGINSKHLYSDIENIISNLMKRVIQIKANYKDKKGEYPWIMFHWVSRASYKDGTITIKLSEELAPYLIGLNEYFTKYEYEKIVCLPTTNSIRLYELLVSYYTVRKTESKMNSLAIYDGIELFPNEIAFTVEYLREYFDCIDKYPNTSDFIKNVIETSIKAIQKKDILPVSYRTERDGRKYTHVIFNVRDYLGKEYGYINELEANRKKKEASKQ